MGALEWLVWVGFALLVAAILGLLMFGFMLSTLASVVRRMFGA